MHFTAERLVDSKFADGICTVQYKGVMWNCKEGTFMDNCNNCLPDLGTTPAEEFMNAVFFSGCCVIFPSGGYAENALDYLVDEVFPAANSSVGDATSGLSRLTGDRDKTMIMGYSLGGLISCHALWTRPEVTLNWNYSNSFLGLQYFLSYVTLLLIETRSSEAYEPKLYNIL